MGYKRNNGKARQTAGFKEFHVRMPEELAKLFSDEAEREERSCAGQLRKILEERYDTPR